MNELWKTYIKDLETENNILLTIIFILIFILLIWICIGIKDKSILKQENAKLEQQVIDYKWQLEQVEWFFKAIE